ncbi:hypothetical protein CWI32_03650 [Acinetobacter pseudolwoffii]|uniref:Uncharacterized protein n=1 Tax=Acinetobacter pseudolwoffii TaxID=2053287 RepID=A0A2H9YVQ9_9GAMM|nr:hypothetical protein CWI32_03650 [Acinetobacter pseudolwoffii]
MIRHFGQFSSIFANAFFKNKDHLSRIFCITKMSAMAGKHADYIQHFMMFFTQTKPDQKKHLK